MKNIYLGDLHGRDTWKQIVKDHEDADNIIFVGDYFDSFDISGVFQLHNAKEIVEYKKWRELDPSKKVHLLIGNHDHHYMPGILARGGTAGFQPTMLHQFEYFFRENEGLFQMCVMIGNVLCTHAGVSETFLKDVGFYTQDNCDVKDIPDFLNDLFKYRPNTFSFYAYVDRNYGCFVDSYGDNHGQSPIWIRPRSLQKDNKKSKMKKEVIQVVGHTQQTSIDIKGKTTGGRYYFIDTIPNGQYLIEENGVFSVGLL